MYYLGVDGGGTKTQAILVDENAKILGIASAGPANIRSVTPTQLADTLKTAVVAAVANSGVKTAKIARSCFGLAGFDHPSDYGRILDAIKLVGSEVDIGSKPVILNDVVCALRRGTDKNYGISIVAGTGSHCYGRDGAGNEAFVAGLGHLLTDEGGGYSIGLGVLHAAARSFDGRAPKSLLEEMLCEFFGVENVRDLVLKIYDEDFGKRQIASLAILCEEAAERGDEAAILILKNAAAELALMVKTVARRLNFKGEIDIVATGGSFKRAAGILRSDFEKALGEDLKAAKIIYPLNEPAMGAVYLAMDYKNFIKDTHLASVK